jgi:hypothetical protein
MSWQLGCSHRLLASQSPSHKKSLDPDEKGETEVEVVWEADAATSLPGWRR